jgi:hypothetical protein
MGVMYYVLRELVENLVVLLVAMSVQRYSGQAARSPTIF